ncbi:energy transducer TonB [Massilia sp. YIM B02763]|uniref:energy transducer TonB n=1 Tax=Massilia sp. YIM B02763 TaxID=3050130 RepID=UPI0025B71CA1|nr:energy transducer TonB [Massilia sp. YIM B02763]MDN4055976.1 energy transducer TonB [Massilia sp. YIM B02763]
MQFSHTNQPGGSRFGKFAVVAGLHAALAILFVQGLDMKKLPLPVPDGIDVTFKAEPVTPPPPPPEPPHPVPQTAPPRLFVPPVEIPVAPPPDPAPVRATTAEPAPQPATPAQQPVADAPPAAKPAAQTGTIRSAVFADANACTLPAYPTRALRNGDAGTTTLALLVGVDGRVTSARVERSSGSRDLDQAAIHALSLCTFKPALNNGVAEAGWARLAYVWTLD